MNNCSHVVIPLSALQISAKLFNVTELPSSVSIVIPFSNAFVKSPKSLDRLLKEKLRSKGWTTEEISYYYECQEGLYYTDIFLHEGTIKILLHKFISILDNFDLNAIAREILNQIIILIFQA